MPPKPYRRLRREERVVLENESKMKSEKIFLVGNTAERRNLCYHREFIWRKGNGVWRISQRKVYRFLGEETGLLERKEMVLPSYLTGRWQRRCRGSCQAVLLISRVPSWFWKSSSNKLEEGFRPVGCLVECFQRLIIYAFRQAFPESVWSRIFGAVSGELFLWAYSYGSIASWRGVL